MMTETSLESIALTVVAWLATYIVHSSLLIGTVWGFTRACKLDSLTRSLLWKLALVGGLFTATLQTGLGVRPLLGQLAMAARAPRAPEGETVHLALQSDGLDARIELAVRRRLAGLDARIEQQVAAELAGLDAELERELAGLQQEIDAEVEAELAGLEVQLAQLEALHELREPGELVGLAELEALGELAELAELAELRELPEFTIVDEQAAPPRGLVVLAASGECLGAACPWTPGFSDSFPVVSALDDGGPSEPGRGPWLLLAGLFLAGATISLGRLGVTARLLQTTLRGRVNLSHGPLRERLSVLLGRARIAPTQVRLTLSPALRSPIALASREIIVPTRALDLEGRQQEAMLAHELAHVVRRDPAWLVLAAVIEALLFIQPLNRVARRGMQEAAEELSDDWAVRHIGGGLHLARCLAEVAGWLERGRATEPFASPMASENGSILVRRVKRLLDDGAGARRGLAARPGRTSC